MATIRFKHPVTGKWLYVRAGAAINDIEGLQDLLDAKQNKLPTATGADLWLRSDLTWASVPGTDSIDAEEDDFLQTIDDAALQVGMFYNITDTDRVFLAVGANKAWELFQTDSSLFEPIRTLPTADDLEEPTSTAPMAWSPKDVDTIAQKAVVNYVNGNPQIESHNVVIIHDSTAKPSVTNNHWAYELATALRSHGALITVHVFSEDLTPALKSRVEALSPAIVLVATGTDILKGVARDATTDVAFLTGLPGAKVYVRSVLWDEEHHSLGAVDANRQVVPALMRLATVGETANSFSTEMLSTNPNIVPKLEEWDAYVEEMGTAADATINLPHYMLARLGLTGVDGLTFISEGHSVAGYVLAGQLYDSIHLTAIGVDEEAKFPVFRDLIDEVLVSDGNDWSVRESLTTPNETDLKFLTNASNWFLPSKGSVTVTQSPAAETNAILVSISDSVPNATVWISVNNSSYSIFSRTDSNGNALEFLPQVYRNTDQLAIRIKIGRNIYGPIEYSNPAQTPYTRAVFFNGALQDGLSYPEVLVEATPSSWDGFEYVAPAAGLYFVSASVRIANASNITATSRPVLTAGMGGAVLAYGTEANNSLQTAVLKEVLPLNVGDRLAFAISAALGASIVQPTEGSASWLTVTKIN